MSTQSVLAVIPCRGGSKRIPRKWAQLVDGRPLLQHTIDIARAAKAIDRLAVCTEDPAVAAYARLRGVDVIDRPAHLAEDDVMLSEVVQWIATEVDDESDIVVLQPTCPLLKPETVNRIIGEWRQLRFDWAITVTADPHIFWQDGRPLTGRQNSQQIAENPRCLQRESGAVQMFTAQAARGLVNVRGTFPIPADEALDIDTYTDLAAARAALGRRTILFHVVASDEKGSGHLRRCLQLSDALAHHEVLWSPIGLDAWAIDIAERHGVRWTGPSFTGEDVRPDLVVVDTLDDAEYLVPKYVALGVPTVVFEPDGASGRVRRLADLIIDEFSEPSLTILRPEFLCLPPYEVRERADHVVVSFGGTDPTGMNQRVRRILNHGADATVSVMHARRPGSMAERMRWADLVVTSQGRTVHEAAAVGVPCLSIAVNERESRHAYLDGVVYLGLSACLSDSLILDTVNRLLGSPALRREMSVTASRQIDGRGLGRVVRKIEDLLA